MTRNHTWVRRTELAQLEAKRVELHRVRRRRVPGAFRSFVARVTAWFRCLRQVVREWAASVKQAFDALMPVVEPIANDLLRQRLADDLGTLRVQRLGQLPQLPIAGLVT